MLIDSGYVRHAPLTLALLRVRARARRRDRWRSSSTPTATPTTSAATPRSRRATAARSPCPRARRRWSTPGTRRRCWLDYCDQRAERFAYDEIIAPDATHVWGDLEWQALAAPGHDMGALVFFNPEHRILISGDALWENGFGLVMPRGSRPAALPATRATLEMIAGLDVRTS